MKISLLWKVLLICFAVSVTILLVSGELSVAIFAMTFGGGYGGFIFTQRDRIRYFFESRKLDIFPVYITLAILVSVAEEIYVYSLGNRIAVPNIFSDIIIVPGEWAVWFTVWYYFIARRYLFNTGTALFTAGLEGLLFEYLGNGLALSNPIGFIVSIPTTIAVYASIFVLPMQLINFKGKINRWWKYPIAVILPYIFTLPAALLLYAIFN